MVSPHREATAPGRTRRPGAQQKLIAENPERFFRPPYVGHRGSAGVRLDGDVDWAEIAELCADAYATVTAKRANRS